MILPSHSSRLGSRNQSCEVKKQESFGVTMLQISNEPCLNTLDILAKSFELSISELMRAVVIHFCLGFGARPTGA